MQSLKVMSDTQAGGECRKFEAQFREALTRHSGGRDWSALEPALPELVAFVKGTRQATEGLPPYVRLDRNERKRRKRRYAALCRDQWLLSKIADIAVFDFGARTEIYSQLKAALKDEIEALNYKNGYKLTDSRIQRKLVACATILDDEGVTLSGWLLEATALAMLELSGLTVTDFKTKLTAARKAVKARKQAVSGN